MRVAPIPPRKQREANPEYVAILQQALSLLWDGRSHHRPNNCWREYVCHCISEAHTPKSLVQTPLEGLITSDLQTWSKWSSLTYASALFHVTACCEWSRAEIQDGRRRWLLQLIEEFGGQP